MHDLTYRQEKIQQKRKQTPFRDFVMEIATWFPAVFHRNGTFVSRYPNTPRCDSLSTYNDFFDTAPKQTLDVYKELTFGEHLQKLRNKIPKPNLVNF
ncbi:MAG: hypothetical protein LBP53_03770 [Candidatus Peribacteria bacterium]|jgi:hypothetical protein|nr:hypothetical protein [Candidatus Peribacteria bacterium]